MAIRFHSEKIKFTPRNTAKLKRWISAVAKKEKHSIDHIEYVFCNDSFLLKLNQQFLDHDTLTDIITFDYSEGKRISGEICISLQRVKENAKKFGVGFETELHRVMIHGVLHLLGYRDKTKKEKEEIRKMEDRSLAMLV
ncbi:MAG TPA: rRNA maturation RNase YbeY [Bacteroidia bacterium]|jgi:rRNA maturation RNase YbeY